MGIRHAYEGTLNVLRHYGLLEGAVVPVRPPGSPDPVLVRADRLESYVPCPLDGIWEPVVEPGECVAAGQLIGRLHDFSDHSLPAHEVRASRAGRIAMMHLSARPSRGQTLYVLAEELSWSEVLA
jgi:predicted deacylase